jgi:ATP-dependent DNA helicase RecQ
MELTLSGVAVMKGTRPPPASLIDIAGMPQRSGQRASRRGTRATGTNPRALGTSPKSLRLAPKAAESEPHDSDSAQPLPMDEDVAERYARLKSARSSIAREAGLPPYVISHDSVLRLIAESCPTDLGDLATIKGFGQVRAAKYGEALLKALSPP